MCVVGGSLSHPSACMPALTVKTLGSDCATSVLPCAGGSPVSPGCSVLEGVEEVCCGTRSH